MDKNNQSKDQKDQPIKNEDRKQIPEEKQEVIRENPDNISDPDISSGVC